jgi:hypothetical protein
MNSIGFVSTRTRRFPSHTTPILQHREENEFPMKRILSIVTALIIAEICLCAQDKQHSIEITTG